MSIRGAAAPTAEKFDETARKYDAMLFLSFGGPEGMEDVIPFLENVTRGRNIPRERLEEVAEHYYHYNGVSPINAQNRALIAALEEEFRASGINLPIYFGNRNWDPYVKDTIAQMRADGVQRAIVFVTSAMSSYSGCRQYRENVITAVDELGLGDEIAFDKIRVFYNHPGFVEPMANLVRSAIDTFPEERRGGVHVVFTAHSIPNSMAAGCAYEVQLAESCRLVAELAGAGSYELAYQSRSGAPHIPWLEPDIADALDRLHAEGKDDVVVSPIGFISDHLEVLYDLDDEAQEHAVELGMTMVRAGTVGTHPVFVAMIRELVQERMTDHPERRFLGNRGPNHDICPMNCCLSGAGRPAPAS